MVVTGLELLWPFSASAFARPRMLSPAGIPFFVEKSYQVAQTRPGKPGCIIRQEARHDAQPTLGSS